jgi:hypothetical protein
VVIMAIAVSIVVPPVGRDFAQPATDTESDSANHHVKSLRAPGESTVGTASHFGTMAGYESPRIDRCDSVPKCLRQMKFALAFAFSDRQPRRQ